MVSFYQRIIGNQGLSQVEKNVLHPYIMVCMFISHLHHPSWKIKILRYSSGKEMRTADIERINGKGRIHPCVPGESENAFCREVKILCFFVDVTSANRL